MTLFFPDVSDGQAGVSFDGLHVVTIKATEGISYTNPDYDPALQRARAAGAFPVAYHFLHEGDAAAQAEHAYSVAGKTPLMLDVEVTGDSNPGVADAAAFIDAYRKLEGACHFLYLPEWYWARVLQAASLTPLTDRGMLLWSSNYVTYSDADAGAGWLPYGGVTPAIWQYTDKGTLNGQSPVDWNAFRGHEAGKQDPASVAATVAEFKALATTGQFPVPVTPADPVPPYTYAAPRDLTAVGGHTSVRLTWNPPAPVDGRPAPAEYKVWIYLGTTCDDSTLVSSYPRPATASPWQGGGLAEGKTYTAHVCASGPDGTHMLASAYAPVVFTTGLRATAPHIAVGRLLRSRSESGRQSWTGTTPGSSTSRPLRKEATSVRVRKVTFWPIDLVRDSSALVAAAIWSRAGWVIAR